MQEKILANQSSQSSKTGCSEIARVRLVSCGHRKWRESVAAEAVLHGVADPQLATLAGGKPCFANCDSLKFSVSDTGGEAFVALAGIEVGLDIEFAHRKVSALAIAKRHFHPDEHAWLARIAENGRQRLFLALWTAKEAAVKLTGEGIHRGLCKVRLFPENGRLRGHYAGRELWFRQVRRADGLIATVAAFEHFALAARPDFQLSVTL